tara:strand:- start:2813 stop:3376 length:564 start_codon:yes stop_codon:yes gene_type:complete
MRIISGFLKGKKIDFLKSTTTRPLRDFVKESIFNVMQHSTLINVSLDGANVLDLYSGVGSFGIECISRGAKKISFVESDSKALIVLKKNLEKLNVEKKSNVFGKKIISFLDQLDIDIKYEIFFLDPPFSENFFLEDLKMIKKSNIFKKNHIIIIHREYKSQDDTSGVINIIATKKYGRSKVIFGSLA